MNTKKIDEMDRKRCLERAMDRVKKIKKADNTDWIKADPERFTNYSKEFIKNCKNKVANIKKDFDNNEIKKYATVLEAIIYEQWELSNWFGFDSHTFKTSEYDDIINWVDLYTEYAGDNSVLGYAIDVTFAKKKAYLEKKFDRIKDEIDRGTLSKIDFFVSDNHDIVGQKNKVPRCILSVDKSIVQELMEVWLDWENKEFGTHVLQFMMLDQLYYQLSLFKKYAQKVARSTDKDMDNIIENYDRDLVQIQVIIDNKKNLLEESWTHLDKNKIIETTKNDVVDVLGLQESKKDLDKDVRSQIWKSFEFTEFYNKKHLSIMRKMLDVSVDVFK